VYLNYLQHHSLQKIHHKFFAAFPLPFQGCSLLLGTAHEQPVVLVLSYKTLTKQSKLLLRSQAV
jgi:hypothetical protein